jgi:hypothetical protein
VQHFEISLCAALVAQAISAPKGVSKARYACRPAGTCGLDQPNFIRPKTVAAVGARIVPAHAALQLVQLWGAGDVASADGMRLIVVASAIRAGPNPRYFGQSPG